MPVICLAEKMLVRIGFRKSSLRHNSRKKLRQVQNWRSQRLKWAAQKTEIGWSAKVDGPVIKNRKAKIGWSKKKRDEIERSSGMREDRSKSLKWPFYIFSRRHSHFDWFGPFTFGRMTVNIDSSSGTVHFRPANDRPIWLKPLSFEQLINFHPSWSSTFGLTFELCRCAILKPTKGWFRWSINPDCACWRNSNRMACRYRQLWCWMRSSWSWWCLLFTWILLSMDCWHC